MTDNDLAALLRADPDRAVRAIEMAKIAGPWRTGSNGTDSVRDGWSSQTPSLPEPGLRRAADRAAQAWHDSALKNEGWVLAGGCMTSTDLKPCRGCGVPAGSLHEHGCDVERCPRCGGQMIAHDCVYEVCGLDPDALEEEHPDIYNNGPTDEMYERWDKEWGARRMPWTGHWPGDLECREYGFWCLWGPDMTPPRQGWVSVPAGTPGATEDLNKLAAMTVWDPEQQKYILRDPENTGDLP